MWSSKYFSLAFTAGIVTAQQVYLSSNDTTGASDCVPAPSTTGHANISVPSYQFSSFGFTLAETTRTATSVSAQATTTTTTTTFGPPYEQASRVLPSFATSSWGNYRPAANTTAAPDSALYGRAAFTSVWKAASLPNVTLGLYSTTVSPVPVPTSELVYPPPLYFQVNECLQFSSDFVFGVSGAAAQIEGAVTDEGRTPAVVDFFGALAALVDPTTPSYDDYTAIENYYLYRQDIERLAAIGMKYYSFSVSWPRILPFALPGTPVNSQAIDHYNDLINFILEKGMVPMVTLTHFDTPLMFIGGSIDGLLSRVHLGRVNYGYQNETFQDAFVNYGKLVMAHFADRVPYWITFNEPQAGVDSGPSIDNIIKSHARLYHFYHSELNGTGQVSIKMGEAPAVPLIPTNQTHVDATMHRTDLYIATFLNPLALGQDYPDAYKMTIQDYVPLTAGDLEYLNNTVDFIAADIYAAPAVYPIVSDIAACAGDNDTSNPYYPSCVGTTEQTVNGWGIGYHPDYNTYTTPKYLRTQLSYYWNTFRKPVMITEFGLSLPAPAAPATLDDERFDVQRSEHIMSILNEMLHSIWGDGVHLLGAVMWSYADNWEWGTFGHRFGLQYTNRTTQERFYRRSLFDTIDFVESRRAKV